jgi:hypothetical protein
MIECGVFVIMWWIQFPSKSSSADAAIISVYVLLIWSNFNILLRETLI